MSANFSLFFDQQILPRKSIIEERNIIYTWDIDRRIPEFIKEKVEEIKLMIVLGMDNYSIKSLILLLEEVMFHILVGTEIKYEEQYLEVFSNIEKDKNLMFGWQVLKELHKRQLLHQDDYLFCSRFFNNKRNGGERLRNIEIHNLIAEKMEKFTIRQNIANKIDDQETIEIVTKMIKQKPHFIHISSRDMVTRDIVSNLAGLYNLLNRSAEVLSKFNNLPNKESYEILESMDKSKLFYCNVKFKDLSILELIHEDILKLGDIDKILYNEISDNRSEISGEMVFHTSVEHTSFEVMQALFYVKSSDKYEIGEVGIKD